jgi:hypothetical protein
MVFTEEQLAKIAAWQVADERFNSSDPMTEYIRPAVSALSDSGRWQCHIVDDGGLSNYCSIGVHPSLDREQLSLSRHYMPYYGDGIFVYLSLLMPIGVMGRASFTIASDLFSAVHLELTSIIPPIRRVDPTVDAIFDAFSGSIYRFLDRDALSQRLPPHIKPDEYCLCEEPWDRVFHVLFANTD